jgi:DNA replication ATP-dependent helicase Dna2
MSLYLQKVIATSCLGINHQVFTQRKFDVCIVDEASQVLQPACLGPLFCSNRFVLVGDPKQLPPVVQCKEARELGMDESLFCRLDSQGATFDLNVQYRMNSEIMKISNILVYDGCLKCGSDAVSKQTLEIEQSNLRDSIVCKSPWMNAVFDGNLHKSVIVLDTRTLNAKHISVKTGGYKNEKEAEIVTDIVISLCKVGIHSADIGVIAPYRSQVIYIRDKLGQGHSGSEVEVNTVDQYQGRDKDVIIISFVMSSTGTTGKVS